MVTWSQQGKNFQELLKEFPQFQQVGVLSKRRYIPREGRGRRPANREVELFMEFLSPEHQELCNKPGVYILVHEHIGDFYTGHAGTYFKNKHDGFIERVKRYINGLHQKPEDTNKHIAELAFTAPLIAWYFPYPTAPHPTTPGEVIYIGESIETYIIQKYKPIYNTRTH